MQSTPIVNQIRSNWLHLVKRSAGAKLSYKLLVDLKELTLDRFIDAYCNNNLQAIVSHGTPPQEVLQSAWEEVQTKYVEIVGGDDYRDKVTLVNQINALCWKLERLEALIEVLGVCPSEGLYEQLYTFDYSLPELPYNEPNLDKLCRLVTAQMKRDVVQVQILTERIKKETPQEQKKTTEADFYNMLVEISDAFKVVLNEKQTSVMAFAMYINKYKQKAEQIQQQQLKHTT